MKVIEVLDTVLFKTCIVKREIVEYADTQHSEWKAAYSLIDGSYIGDCKDAEYFERKGIMPESKSGCKTASIGFCKKEQKWYGWSHRALYSYGIGSEVKKSSCAYKPVDPKDLLEDTIRFWAQDEDECVTKVEVVWKELDVGDPNGNRGGLGVLIETKYKRKKDNIGLGSVHWEPYPKKWGKGEWKAKTLEDAKQMAIDFSDGVS